MPQILRDVRENDTGYSRFPTPQVITAGGAREHLRPPQVQCGRHFPRAIIFE
jgi:hypothetical protein